MKILQYTAATIAAICLINGAANAQSMVDLAKRERQRQKTAESKTVLTNDSPRGDSAGKLTTATPAAEPAATAAPAQAPASSTVTKPATTSGPTDSKGRDEKFWRATFDKARQDVKRSEDKVKLLQLKVNDLTSRIRRDSLATRANEEQAELDKTNKELAIAQHELAEAQQRIPQLEEELRRSGGLPGWAR